MIEYFAFNVIRLFMAHGKQFLMHDIKNLLMVNPLDFEIYSPH